MEMIVYHFFGTWCIYLSRICRFHSSLCYWWQQSICWRFIFLSGFCWPLGKRAVRRAVQVFGGSVLVMLITHIFGAGPGGYLWRFILSGVRYAAAEAA